MDNTSDIRVGDRLRIDAGVFGDRFEVTAQRVFVRTIVLIDVRFDDGVEGLLWRSSGMGPLRFVRMGWVRSVDVAGLVIVPRATDLEDEDEVAA